MRPSRWRPAVVACLLTLAGCGGSGAAGSRDPAKAVPADIPVYLEGVVKPGARQGDTFDTLFRAATGLGGPEAEFDSLLRQRTGSDQVSYARNVEPWLGRRIGVGYFDLAGDRPRVLIVAAVTDTEKAKAFVRADAAGAELGEHRGATYFKEGRFTIGVKDHHLLLVEGVDRFKAAVDRLDDGTGSLADDNGYRREMDALPGDRLGAFHVDIDALRALAATGSGTGGAEVADQLLSGFRGLSGALTVTGDRALLETRVRADGDPATLALFGPFVAPALVREAPSDALATFGVKAAGATAKATLETVLGDVGGAAVTAQVSRDGLDLERDAFSWIGDTAAWMRGRRLEAVDGAVMVTATDATAAAAALPRLARAARLHGLLLTPARFGGATQAFSTRAAGARTPTVLARKGSRVVLALGEDAARAALKPSRTLDASGAYERAKKATGGYAPSLVLDLRRTTALANASGTDDPDYATLKPYLERLALLVAGAKRDGDTLVSRVALTVG